MIVHEHETPLTVLKQRWYQKAVNITSFHTVTVPPGTQRTISFVYFVWPPASRAVFSTALQKNKNDQESIKSEVSGCLLQSPGGLLKNLNK